MTYLLPKIFKGLNCCLKNLKNLTITNAKLKGLLDTFGQKISTAKFR
jgi:hypothetical protein